MSEGWTAVVLQRAKQRVSIDLIARASQIATSIIIAEIVTVRSDGASVVDNISSGIASFQNRVCQIYGGLAGIVNTAAVKIGCVAAKRAVEDFDGCVAALIGETATIAVIS